MSTVPTAAEWRFTGTEHPDGLLAAIHPYDAWKTARSARRPVVELLAELGYEFDAADWPRLAWHVQDVTDDPSYDQFHCGIGRTVAVIRWSESAHWHAYVNRLDDGSFAVVQSG